MTNLIMELSSVLPSGVRYATLAVVVQVTHAVRCSVVVGGGIFLGLSAENYRPSKECGSIFFLPTNA